MQNFTLHKAVVSCVASSLRKNIETVTFNFLFLMRISGQTKGKQCVTEKRCCVLLCFATEGRHDLPRFIRKMPRGRHCRHYLNNL